MTSVSWKQGTNTSRHMDKGKDLQNEEEKKEKNKGKREKIQNKGESRPRGDAAGARKDLGGPVVEALRSPAALGRNAKPIQPT